MALELISVSGLLCEKVLQEGESVFSAIRIVDIFNVAHDSPPNSIVQFYGLVILKAFPTADIFNVSVAIVAPSGERRELPEPPGSPFKLPVYENDPSVPAGFSLVLQFNIVASKMGTYFIEVAVDGVAVTRMPFTLRQLPAPPTAQ